MQLLRRLARTPMTITIWLIMLNFSGQMSFLRHIKHWCLPFRKHGRYMSNKGYVDSSRRIRSLHRQQDDLHISPHHLSPSRGGLLAAINKSPLSLSAPPATTPTPRKLKASSENDLTSISANLENKKKDYEKQMRLIEVGSIAWESWFSSDALFFRNEWSKRSRANAKLNVSKAMWRKSNGWSVTHFEIWTWVSKEDSRAATSLLLSIEHSSSLARYDKEALQCASKPIEESSRERSHRTGIRENTREGETSSTLLCISFCSIESL